MASRAVHQVDGILVVADMATFIAAVEGEFQAGQRRPGRLYFGAPQRGVKVQIDRSAVHDLRNLIILVIVIIGIGVEDQVAIEQRVLGAQLIGIDEFGLEVFRMHRLHIVASAILNQDRAGRILAASLVAVAVRRIDQSLIGEIEFGLPAQHRAAGQLMPGLVHGRRGRIARIAVIERQRLGRDFDEMLGVIGPAQTTREFQILSDVVISLAETRIGIDGVGVLAVEVVVPAPVELCQRIGIDIGLTLARQITSDSGIRIGPPEDKTKCLIGTQCIILAIGVVRKI